jgi:hypothetical protein
VHIEGESKFASCDAGGLVVVYDYAKKKELWKMKHSSDCKCLYVDQSLLKLFACVKTELIPHELNEGVISLLSNLPALKSGSNVKL